MTTTHRAACRFRQRRLTVIIDGLHAEHLTQLPGHPSTWEEQTERWLTW